ncbi:transposase [Nocardioides sp.]
MLDALHVTKLGTDAVDQVRRRVQQTIHSHAAARATSCTGSG